MKTKQSKRKNIRNIIIVLIVVMMLCTMPYALAKLSKNINKKETSDIVYSLINEIKKDKENKLVYLLNDLENLGNTEYESFSDTSYITYYDEKIFVCITNDKYNIAGDEKN